MRYLRQSTSVDVVIGPVWSTTDGALKSDLAYNASGINCDIYKNGTKADISLQGTAGNGYLRPGSGEAQYILTLSTTDTNTIGSARITLSATGFYMRPEEFVVLHANVYDALFGSTALATVGAKMDLVDAPNTTAREAFRTTMQAAGTTLATLLSRIVGTLAIGTHNPQSGDAYAIVNNGTYGNAKLVRSSTPANALAVDASGKVAVPDTQKVDVNTVKGQSVTCAAGVTVRPDVGTATQSAAQSGDAYGRLGAPNGASVSADIAAVKTDSAAAKAVADKLNTTLKEVEGNGAYQFKAVALENAPSGGGSGEADWSADEKKQIRSALGIDGAKVAAENGQLQAIQEALDDLPELSEAAEAIRDVDNASPAAGSLGAKVNSAASAGDPWSTALPGSYSTGSAGKLVGDMAGTVSTNLDGKISSRAEPGDKMDLVDAPNATALTAIRTALQAAGSTLATLLSRIVGTLDSGTHKPQSGDAYGIVSDGTYGNPAIKSAIPAAAPTTTQIKNELEGSGSHLAAVKSTADKLESTLQSDGVSGHQFTATALENAPSGGGGSGEADWTADERKQIRSALGVTGATASTDSGELQALKSVVDTNLDAKISSRSAFDPASNKVTVATNEDKTGYALTSAYDRAKNAASNVEVTNATSGLSTLDGTDVEQALADYGTAKSSELPDAGPTAAQVADKLLGRNLAGGSDGGRTVRQALRPLRNRMEISEEGVMSVYKEDDATVDWEAAVTTDAAAEPITKVDPV